MKIDQLSGNTVDTTVVDCDIHLSTRSPEMRRKIAKQLDEPHRSHLDPDTETFGSPYGGSGWNRSIGGKIDWFKQDVTTAEDIQVPICERFGVDYPIINAFHVADRIQDPDRGMQEVRALNNILLDILDEEDHFRGLIATRTKDPHQLAEEIDRLGDENQIVGVFLETIAQEKPLGDPQYDVIYKAAEDNGLTVVTHSGGTSPAHFPFIDYGFTKYMAVHALSFPVQNMVALTSFLVEGTPEKFPDLNFVMLEAGLAWVPYMMGRLNREYGERRSEAPLLKKSPEEYIRDQFYFGTQPIGELNDPADLIDILEVVGTDSIVFASDYPHHDFDDLGYMDRLFNRFGDDAREKMLHGNAIEAFDLDVKPNVSG